MILFTIIVPYKLLHKDEAHAIPADIGKIIKSKSVINKVIEVDVAPIIHFVSIDSNIVFRVFYFLYFFFLVNIFIFEVCSHSINFTN